MDVKCPGCLQVPTSPHVDILDLASELFSIRFTAISGVFW